MESCLVNRQHRKWNYSDIKELFAFHIPIMCLSHSMSFIYCVILKIEIWITQIALRHFSTSFSEQFISMGLKVILLLFVALGLFNQLVSTFPTQRNINKKEFVFIILFANHFCCTFVFVGLVDKIVFSIVWTRLFTSIPTPCGYAC